MGAVGTLITTAVNVPSITSADIESFLNTCLEEAVTEEDLANAIKLCLRDLSNLNFLIDTDESQSVESGDYVLLYPEAFKDLESIILTDASDNVLEPLVALSGGHREYRRLMASGGYTGIPEYYSEYNGQFFLYPAPSATFTALIEFFKYDNQDETDIEFGIEFSNAIKYGTVYFYALMKSRQRYVDIWGPLYENEKAIRRLNMKLQPRITE